MLSTLDTGWYLSIERRTRFDFLRRKWLRLCFNRRSFRFFVTLKRFAVALCVFILGTLIVLLYLELNPVNRDKLHSDYAVR